MRLYLSICLLLLAINLAKCSPIEMQAVNDDDENNDQEIANKSTPMGQHELQSKNQRLVDQARKIFQKLKSDGKNTDATKLWRAIECALEQLRAYSSINPGREYNFSVREIMNNLKKSQDRLEHLIKDLKNGNHYTD